jgi:uncharacterized protein
VTLLAGVLLASLLGSVHCGAMCSAFACLATRQRTHGMWYHSGRLGAYLTLGLLAGAFGAAVNSAGTLVSVQHTAAIVTAVLLMTWGTAQLASTLRARHTAASAPWADRIASLLHRTDVWEPRVRALSIGAVTGLLPCGWLWAFIATALGTGSPARAALVMCVFWIGTVPMLVAVTAGVRRFGPLARVRWPLASASIVLLLGAGQFIAHLVMPPMSASAAQIPHSHGASPK